MFRSSCLRVRFELISNMLDPISISGELVFDINSDDSGTCDYHRREIDLNVKNVVFRSIERDVNRGNFFFRETACEPCEWLRIFTFALIWPTSAFLEPSEANACNDLKRADTIYLFPHGLHFTYQPTYVL